MGNFICKVPCTERDETPQEDIGTSHMRLECAVCGQNIDQFRFKRHLDSHHFATVEEVGNKIKVSCLLCKHQSPQIEDHAQHLTKTHPYAAKFIGSQTGLTNKDSKANIKEIFGLSQFTSESATSQEGILQVDGKQYRARLITKAYEGIDYNEETARAELVWFPLLGTWRDKYKGFLVSKKGVGGRIVCDSYLIQM